MKVIPYSHQILDREDINEVLKVLKSDWITQGPKIEEFEDALCKYTSAKYAVAVSSGTAALHIACAAAGIKTGDEVITSPMTFVASANCAIFCGGKPVFVDVKNDTINIDPNGIGEKITKNTKAILPVHFAGHPCEMDEIYAIAREHDLIVIEDAAHAVGARYKKEIIGSCRYSDMAVFSFHPVKSITTGEGGAVLTNRKELFEKLIMLRNHGITKKEFFNKPHGGWYYEMQLLGYNYRMTDIQAALGISQLKKLDKFIEARRSIAKRYDEAFCGNPYFDTPNEKEWARSAYHIYPIRLKKKYIRHRKTLFSGLRREGVGAQIHYIPVHFHPYYQGLGYRKGDYPIAEDYYKKAITIPLYPNMGNREIAFVIKTLLKTLGRL